MPKFKIELIIFFVLLLGITFLSWQLLSDDTKAKVTGFPAQLISSLPNARKNTAKESPAATTPADKALPLSPAPTPTILPLPGGAQTYRFSISEDTKGPKIQSLTINPLTVASGATQTITLAATHPNPITEVTIEVITDKNSTPHTLSLSSGQTTDGVWQGSWPINDTYDYQYGLRLVLKSSSDLYDNTMWFRR